MSYKKSKKTLYPCDSTRLGRYLKANVLETYNVVYVGNRNTLAKTTSDVTAEYKKTPADTSDYITVGTMKYPPATTPEDSIAIMIPVRRPTPTHVTISHEDWRSTFRHKSYEAMYNPDTTDVAIYSVTPINQARKIVQLLLGYYPDLEILTSKVLTDATAGVGGVTCAFAPFVQRVNAIELDPVHADILSGNIKILKLDNVATYQGSFIDYLGTIEQDIMFIDPPCTIDPNNKQLIELGFAVNNRQPTTRETFRTLENLLNTKLAHSAQVIMMKLPVNYNYASFANLKYYPFVNMVVVKSMSGTPMYNICIVSKFSPVTLPDDIKADRYDHKNRLLKHIPVKEQVSKKKTTKKKADMMIQGSSSSSSSSSSDEAIEHVAQQAEHKSQLVEQPRTKLTMPEIVKLAAEHYAGQDARIDVDAGDVGDVCDVVDESDRSD